MSAWICDDSAASATNTVRNRAGAEPVPVGAVLKRQRSLVHERLGLERHRPARRQSPSRSSRTIGARNQNQAKNAAKATTTIAVRVLS